MLMMCHSVGKSQDHFVFIFVPERLLHLMIVLQFGRCNFDFLDPLALEEQRTRFNRGPTSIGLDMECVVASRVACVRYARGSCWRMVERPPRATFTIAMYTVHHV